MNLDDIQRLVDEQMLPAVGINAFKRKRYSDCARPGWVVYLREPLSPEEQAATPEIRKRVASSSAVAALLAPRITAEIGEVMYVLGLDGQNRVVFLHEVARGGLHSLAVAAQDILRVAIVTGSSGVIIAHNHPSGDPTPSKEDLAMTRAVKEAAQCVGIQLLDHLIIAHGGGYSSLRDLGIL